MSSKTDTVVKLAIVFFISLLSFSVGTFVGKKYSDNQHQLAILEPQKQSGHQEREVASVKPTEEANKTGAMTDEEIAKLAEEFVADETTAPVETGHEAGHGNTTTAASTHGENPHAENPSHTEKNIHSLKTEEPSLAAKNIAAGKAPTSTEPSFAKKGLSQEDRIPSSLPKDVAQYSVGKFTVQIASYADEAEAQKTASDLKNKGYSAFYIPANVKGKTWYRVSVGQFATQKEAQSYRTEFMNTSKVTSAIVQRITE